MQGTVEKIDFTQGGAGNQWTTIDGVRYATWWDVRTRDWHIGDQVSFETYEAPLWSGMAPTLCASNIRKMPGEETRMPAPHIVFTARRESNSVSADTAQEAVRLFLAQFKNRQFTVTEYRDGVFKAVLYGAHSDAGESYFYKSFKNREEARAFVSAA